MANSYKDIIITTNIGSTSDDPKIEFRGGDTSTNTNISLKTYPTSNGTLSFEGSAGQLFSITNDLSGTIFSVNDISGIPSIEVLDTGTVKIAQYSGNVGIGTSTPTYKLDVAGTANTGALTVSSLNITGAAANQIFYEAPSGITGFIAAPTQNNTFLNYTTAAGFTWQLASGASVGNANVSTYQTVTNATTGTWYPALYNGTSGDRQVYANNAFAFNAATGNLGIGTTSPAYKLDVVGQVNASTGFRSNAGTPLYSESTIAYGPQLQLLNFASDATGPYYMFYKGRAGGTTSQSGDTLGTLLWYGRDTSNTNTQAGYIAMVQSAAAGSGSVPAYMNFVVNNSERMRIDSDGRLGIGANPTGSQENKVIVGGTLPSASGYSVSYKAAGIVPSTSTTGYEGFASLVYLQSTSFNISSIKHFTASQPSAFSGGATATNQYGFAVSSNLISANNNFGFHGNLSAANNSWNFYAAGTANNYFNGNVGIGTTTPSYKLDVAGTANTGALTVSSLNIVGPSANQIFYEAPSGITGFIAAPSNATFLYYTTAGGFQWTAATGASVGTANVSAYQTVTNATTGTWYPALYNGTSGDRQVYADSDLSFNASTNNLSISGNPVLTSSANDAYPGTTHAYTHGYIGDGYDTVVDFTDSKLLYQSSVASINASANTPFGAAWYNLVNVRHRGGAGDGNVWGGQLTWGMTNYTNRLAFRTNSVSGWNQWTEVLTTANYTSYTIPSAGGTFAGNVTINGNLSVAGNTTFTGNTSYINVTHLEINDPVIYLGANNYSSDLVSIGFVGNYFNGANQLHTGLFRQHASNNYYLFTGVRDELDNVNVISTSANGFMLATLNANISGPSITATGQFSGPGTGLTGTAASLTAGLANDLTGGAANRIAYQTGTNVTDFVTAPTSASTFLSWNGSAFVWTTASAGSIAGANVANYEVVTNATSGLYYPALYSATSGNLAVSAASTLSYNVSSGVISATAFSGGTAATTSIYSLPNTGGTAQWIFLGTWNNARQEGSKAVLEIATSTGYNAGVAQNSLYKIFFKTSNGSSFQNGSSGNFYADGMVWKSGPSSTITSLRAVQVSNNSFGLYANCSTFTGDNSVYSVSVAQGNWTNSSSLSTPSGNFVDLPIYTYIDSNNYNTYAPTLTGTGASGTWGINVTGTAADVAGGLSNQLLYQTGAGATSYVTAPTVTSTFLSWNGSAFVWSAANSSSIASANVSTYQTVTNATTGTWYPALYNGTSGDRQVNANSALSFNTATGALSATTFSGSHSGSGSGLTGTASSLTAGLATDIASGTANSIVYQFASGDTRFVTAPTISSTFLRWNGTTFDWAPANSSSIASANVANYEVVTTTSDATTHYPSLYSATSGDLAAKTSSSLSYVPSTGALSATRFNGAGTGLTGTASSLTAGLATDVAGGLANQILYQTGAGATSYVTAPTVTSTFLSWNGSAFVWSAANSSSIASANVSTYQTVTNSTTGTWYPALYNGTSGDRQVYADSALSFNTDTNTLTTTTLTTTYQTIEGQATQLLLKPSGTVPTILHRNDGVDYYILLSGASASANGTWNTFRPFSIKTTTGVVTIDGTGVGTNFGGTVTTTGQFSGPGTGLTGTAINLTVGTAVSARGIGTWDGTSYIAPNYVMGTLGSRSVDLLPNTYSMGITSEFKGAGLYGVTGNYCGLITYAPWVGTTSSTGDPSYQLLFNPSAANSTTNPTLRIRAGIDGTWGPWNVVLHSNNFSSYVSAVNANVSTYQTVTNATTGTWYPALYNGTSGDRQVNANSALSFNAATGALNIRGSLGISEVGGAGTRLLISSSGSGAVINQNDNSNIVLQTSGVTRLTIAHTSGDLTATGNISGNRLISTVATGTAPLTVSSTTLVSNLNADLLDGISSGSFLRSDATTDYSGGILRVRTPAGFSGNNTSEVNTLQILQTTGSSDAFMSFHVQGDYAAHFGLDGTTNDLFYGGWSNGSNKYRVCHAGNLGNFTHYIGTTAIALNRASAAQSLTGITSISGSAAFITGTNIGKTGAQGFLSTTSWTSTDWANTAISGLGMTINNTPGAPTTDYGYFAKLGNRDAGGGWGGIWMNYNGGDLYYGSTTVSSANATWYKLATTTGSSTQNTQFNSIGVGTAASGTTGEIRATNQITAYYSDERLKTNISCIPNALEKLNKIRGVTFNANDVAEQYGYTDKKQQVGVIAQEVESVLPEIVVPAPFDIGTNEDGTEYSLSGENYKTVHYEKLVPLLIEAIKEQQKQIDELKSIINSNK